MKKETKIEEWIDKLSNLSSDGGQINFNLLNGDSATKINEGFDGIKNFIDENMDSAHGDEDEHGETFLTLIEKFSELKDSIKHTECTVELTNLELKTITKFLRQKVKYNNVSVFYGIHLKKFLLDKFPKIGNNDFETHKINISFTNAMAVYNLFETIEVTGLGMETYAYGNVLFNLSEITKIYKHYDDLIKSTDNVIGLWNKGINPFKQAEQPQAEPTMKVEE